MSLMNIDYERDLRQAQKLQSYADNECDTILNKLQTAKDALGQCWKGNSGTAMQEVGRTHPKHEKHSVRYAQFGIPAPQSCY